VWGLSNRSDYQLCPTGAVATADGYMLLEGSSTYSRAGTDYCVAVARVQLEYDTADTPDYTFSTANISIIWGPYTDAIWQRTEFKVVAATRAMDAITGDVSYTGATFRPRAIIALGSKDGGSLGRFKSVGFSSAVGSEGVVGAINVEYVGAKFIYAGEDTGKSQDAIVKSYDADGCTLTWTRTGATASATFTFYLFFIR